MNAKYLVISRHGCQKIEYVLAPTIYRRTLTCDRTENTSRPPKLTPREKALGKSKLTTSKKSSAVPKSTAKKWGISKTPTKKVSELAISTTTITRPAVPPVVTRNTPSRGTTQKIKYKERAHPHPQIYIGSQQDHNFSDPFPFHSFIA